MTNQPAPLRQDHNYRVGLGHASVTVKGDSIADAIRKAKSLLRLEMPRMWDVITAMEVRHFKVTQVR